MKAPTQLEWLLAALEAGTHAINLIPTSDSNVAKTFAEEAAFYAFRAFPELRVK